MMALAQFDGSRTSLFRFRLDERQTEPRALLHEETRQDYRHVLLLISDGEELAQGTGVVDHQNRDCGMLPTASTMVCVSHNACPS